jgi:hypothetical protein
VLLLDYLGGNVKDPVGSGIYDVVDVISFLTHHEVRSVICMPNIGGIF